MKEQWILGWTIDDFRNYRPDLFKKGMDFSEKIKSALQRNQVRFLDTMYDQFVPLLKGYWASKPDVLSSEYLKLHNDSTDFISSAYKWDLEDFKQSRPEFFKEIPDVEKR